jgi:hypothetical protein
MCANRIPAIKDTLSHASDALHTLSKLGESNIPATLDKQLVSTVRQFVDWLTYYPAIVWTTSYTVFFITIAIVIGISLLAIVLAVIWHYRAYAKMKPRTGKAQSIPNAKPQTPSWLQRKCTSLGNSFKQCTRALRIPFYRQPKMKR